MLLQLGYLIWLPFRFCCSNLLFWSVFGLFERYLWASTMFHTFIGQSRGRRVWPEEDTLTYTHKDVGHCPATWVWLPNLCVYLTANQLVKRTRLTRSSICSILLALDVEEGCRQWARAAQDHFIIPRLHGFS